MQEFLVSNYGELLLALVYLVSGILAALSLPLRKRFDLFVLGVVITTLGYALFYTVLAFDLQPLATASDFRLGTERSLKFFLGVFLALYWLDGHLAELLGSLRRWTFRTRTLFKP